MQDINGLDTPEEQSPFGRRTHVMGEGTFSDHCLKKKKKSVYGNVIDSDLACKHTSVNPLIARIDFLAAAF